MEVIEDSKDWAVMALIVGGFYAVLTSVPTVQNINLIEIVGGVYQNAILLILVVSGIAVLWLYEDF